LGKIATTILESGNGWSVSDLVCTSGPRDKAFVEQHNAISIAVVLEGSFQYRSARGSEVMSPGSLLLGNLGQSFECGHEHGTGDRCLAFFYTPEFFEHAHFEGGFPVHRIPPIRTLTPSIVQARLGTLMPEKVIFEELALGLADAVVQIIGTNGEAGRAPSAADERRVSSVLRFIEADLGQALSLELVASHAKMSEFHFLRVFRQVTGVTPYQYIIRSRLREAALQLKRCSNDVLSIALDAGFRDLSNFNHAFRTEFGVSPTRFRERCS
jgi:AraC family transcriptional regulator